MEKQINWKAKEALAKKMSISELQYGIADCLKCIEIGLDGGYYADEASIYRKELKERLNRVYLKTKNGRAK